jgi:hypothetical protein
MHSYNIFDVWMALRLAFRNFIYLTLALWIVVLGLSSTPTETALVINGLIFLQSVIVYRANRKYTIDLDSGTVTFPRSDLENSLIAIILLFPYWNLMRTKTILCSDVENMYLDTKRSKRGKKRTVVYGLNIVGRFGSAHLQFMSRQKRDEVRNAISVAVKSVSGKGVDRQVSEFN